MRKEVRKYLFVGLMGDKERFFADAQRAGVIEFIDTAGLGGLPVPEEISTIVSAKKVLRRLEPTLQTELPDLQAADFIAARVLQLQENIEKLLEEKRLLIQEIIRVQPFGNYSVEDLEYLQKASGRIVQFFFAKKGHALGPEAAQDLISVGTAFDLDYYIALNPQRRRYPDVSETHIDRPVGLLRERLQLLEKTIHEHEAELKGFANRKEFLRHALVEKLNDYHYDQAESFALSAVHQSVFAVEGWLPIHLLPQVKKMATELGIFLSEIAIEPSDRVPTYLENKGLARVGEDIVHVYDSPSTTDRDPSRWVLWFFAFFFGVIVGDAGYGLILLAITGTLSWRLWKRGGSIRRFLKLMLLLGASCLVWGALTASWFGISLSPDNGLRNLSLTQYLVEKKVQYILDTRGELYNEWVRDFPQLAQQTDAKGWIETAVKVRDGKTEYFLLDRFTNNVLMEIALLIGCIHLILGFLRVLDRNWAGLGWILFIIGGYFYFPKLVHATSMLQFLVGVDPTNAATIGLQLIWIGLGLAVVLAPIQHRWRGLAEVVNVIQVFADVLSYLRLYALGLAGVMMSMTFNDLAGDVGIVFGILIVLFGHAVNLTLSMMSGVIHGLRLNYLEWYRHCFEGGGRLLAPLRRIHYT